ncbi:EAL domain-containing protein [Massilia sp. GCM10020059]|uniref:EAL domain-containing protein n=1 Tax=Massilia agrisoli TaxID=2892444 RepID=A0ABS8IYD2_9BURK|nr:EAL domain-containing protein [Massilia agrisoli]MCC6073178.1 EAL domain-containing protein [Massilia agrisoli]
MLCFALLFCWSGVAAGQAQPLRVGLYENAPKIFINGKGDPDGIMIDLLRKIAEEENWQLEFVPCAWAACLRALENGDIDVLPDVAWSEERSRTLDFHRTPALHSWSQVYRHPRTAIVSILDLDGKRVAILGGSIQQHFLETFWSQFGIRPTLVPVASIEDGFALVEARKADAMVANKYAGDRFAIRYGLAETPIAFQPAQLFFATAKGRGAGWLAAIERHLARWQEEPDSPYFQVLNRWQQQTLLARTPGYVWWIGGAVVCALMLALLAALWLRRQVRIKSGALRDSQRRLSTILDSVDSLIYIKDADYRYQYVNRAVCQFYGMDSGNILGKSDAEIFDAATAAAIRKTDSQVIEQGERVIAEEVQSLSRADAPTFLSTRIPLCREDGSVYGLCGIATDISERKHAEESTRVAATVFQSQEGMFVTGPDRLVLDVNDAFTTMSGYAAAELVGRGPQPVSLEPGGQDFWPDMWDIISTRGKWQGEVWTRRENGKEYPAWLTVTAVRNAAGRTTNYVGTQADITRQKLAQDEIMQLANYDSLTGLPNRRLLLERLQHCLSVYNRSKQAVALLFLDLDNFKDLNDTRGHEVGDQLLKQVAQRIRDCVREGDTVARLGGDEFVILLESIGEREDEAAEHTAATGWKIIRAIGQPFDIGGGSHHATCSIGAALRVDQETDIDDLMKRGDLAMYEAKRDGRNTLRFFHNNMESDVTYRMALEMELRESLGKSEFVLHYQPQVDGSGTVVGVEALLRWNHIKRGIVGPAVFVPIAEASGLIVQLGSWVIRSACQQLAEWAAVPEMAHLTLAVNVSARQFRQQDFVSETLATIAETGARPDRLKLELTETLLIENVEDTIGKMRQLKQSGISFALDDFGTGYSSLSYLKLLPLDQLKIDRSFVRDVLVDPNDASIARSIVALGQALGLAIIAEGVETEAQRAFLAELGCECCQGYLFGRPMEVHLLEAMIRDMHSA